MSARPRVLLADDYSEMLSAIEQIIGSSCEIVGHVANGARLLETVAALRPDVVVTDVGLPLVSGLEACRRIRQSTPSVKVIVISAADDPHVHQRALELGASTFISKSRLDHELPAAVEKALAGL